MYILIYNFIIQRVISMQNTKKYLIAALLLAGINQNTSLAGPQEDGLAEAIESNKRAQAIEWLNKGADPNTMCYSKRPLHDAVERGDLEMVELLLEKGADTEAKDYNDCTPLYMAVRRNKLYTNQHVQPTTEKRIIELLLNKGANPNSINGGWGGPLHCVAEMVVSAAFDEPDRSCYADSRAEVVSRPITIVKLLLDAGAKKDMRDLGNRTPYDTLQYNLKCYPGFMRHPQVKIGVEKIMSLLRIELKK